MNQVICSLCGNKNLNYFGVKPNGERYCRLCVSFNGKKAEKDISKNNNCNKGDLKLNYPLVKEQEEISNKVLDSFTKHKNCLIYAVCGAGKTELVYKTISYALKNNLKIGFTIPRKDVVIDLLPRLKKAFENANVISLYGGHNKVLDGDIILLTTHQLYRYENYFDLLIIDETDAFPYANSDLLRSFFKKSISKNGNYIMMSATPLKRDIDEIKNQGGDYYTLLKRYHNHKLIEPMVVVKPFFAFFYLIKEIYKFKRNNKPILVFVPTISQCEDLYKHLKIFFKNYEYVHSKRLIRDQIVADFKKRKFDFLITTSILERGITIKDLQVIVFNADNNIFSSSQLVQISGRVGRKIDSWDGEVVFICSHKTKEISLALEQISFANKVSYAM